MSSQQPNKKKKYCIIGVFISQFFLSVIIGCLIGKNLTCDKTKLLPIDNVKMTKEITTNKSVIINSTKKSKTSEFLKSNESECIPKDTYIHLLDLRKYFIRHEKLAISDVLDARPLKIKRCLDFMSPCTSNNYCISAIEKYTKNQVILFKNGKKVGWIDLTLVEDAECKCQKRREEEFSWPMSPVIEAEIHSCS